MPQPRLHPKKPPLQPFSLILEPAELTTLRKIAGKEHASVGAVARRAIDTVLFWTNPELVDRMIGAEMDGFLKRMGEKFPVAVMKGARRGAFKKKVRSFIG